MRTPRFNSAGNESFAIAIGGGALFVASVWLLVAVDLNAWAVFLVAAIVWREYVLAGIRAEVDLLRHEQDSDNRAGP